MNLSISQNRLVTLPNLSGPVWNRVSDSLWVSLMTAAPVPTQTRRATKTQTRDDLASSSAHDARLNAVRTSRWEVTSIALERLTNVFLVGCSVAAVACAVSQALSG